MENKVKTDIKSERLKQIERFGGADHDDQYTEQQFIELIDSYFKCVKDANYFAIKMEDHKNIQYRRFMVKTAALCIAAIESFDRKHKDD